MAHITCRRSVASGSRVWLSWINVPKSMRSGARKNGQSLATRLQHRQFFRRGTVAYHRNAFEAIRVARQRVQQAAVVQAVA